MKNLFLILLFIPLSLAAITKSDSLNLFQSSVLLQIKQDKNKINDIQKEILELEKKQQTQENINDKTINGISTQIGAASFSLSIFGILFAIAAIILGIYITRIEGKVVRLSEENRSLLNQTIKNKEEVVEINNLIQKDIYGLYSKIKREETNYLLNRLLVVPQDVANLSQLLLSRDLEKEDFKILKEAYLKTKKLPEGPRTLFSVRMSYVDTYKLLFFQHFLDLSLKDKDIGNDLINFYDTAINCAFENDIIKSSSDFINALISIGYKSKGEDISSFMKGISISKYNNFEDVYKIFFDTLKNRVDQFDFFDLILDDKDSRVAKANYGKLLISNYSSIELRDEEKAIIEKTKSIISELEKEENKSDEKKVAETTE